MLYLLANYYLLKRALQALPLNKTLKKLFVLAFAVVSLSFIASRFLRYTQNHNLHFLTDWIGSLWIIALLYFLLIVIILDFLRLLNHFTKTYPTNSLHYVTVKFRLFIVSVILVTVTVIGGYINASHATVVTLNIKLNKPLKNHKNIKIVAVSDVHLGNIIQAKRAQQLSNQIMQQNPDIILFIGDLLDEVDNNIIAKDVGAPLRELKAPMGVWAINGNHEFFGGVELGNKYIRSLNMKLLRDSVAFIDSTFYLVGREDITIERFENKKRASLKSLTAHINTNYPIILLDHQPYKLNEAQNNKISLQLSGHTHNGQFWPLNYVVGAMFELSWGYLKKGNTHYYVSCGWGSWGPPVRIGNRPEIVVINLEARTKN